jgi:hypothetical protein
MPYRQSFSAFRIYRFTESHVAWVAYICWALAFMGFGSAVSVAVGVVISSSIQAFKQNFGFLLTAVLVIAASIDTIITFAMFSYVNSQQNTSLGWRCVDFLLELDQCTHFATCGM